MNGRCRVAFGVALAASACILLSWASRGWLMIDDFNALGSRLELVERRGWWSGLNAAHNGHWSAGFFALHLGVVFLTGLESYVPMAVLAVASAGAAVVVLRSCLTRLGTHPWVAALWPPTLLWWGTAPLSVLWGFDAVFTMAAMLVLLTALLLGRPERWTRWTLAVALLAGAALSGTVVIGVGVVAVVWSVSAVGRTERWARVRSSGVVIAPSALATLAWMSLRDRRAVVMTRLPGEMDLYNNPPEFVGGLRYASALGRRVLSGFAPGPTSGPIAWCSAGVVAVVLVVTVVRHRRDPRATTFVLGLPAAAVVLTIAIGVTRAGSGQGAEVSRYLHLVTVLLFPLAGLAVSDAARWSVRCAGEHRGRRVVAVAPLGALLIGLVVVGALRIREESDVLHRRGQETKALLKAHLADPLLGLVPLSTRVAYFALDMNVGHLLRLGERGWLTPERGDDAVRSAAALWVHVRSVETSDAPELTVGRRDAAPPCWSSGGGVRIADVELLTGRTGAIRWTDEPRRVWVRWTIGEATTPWRGLRSASVLEFDGVEGAVVEIRVTGPASTC